MTTQPTDEAYTIERWRFKNSLRITVRRARPQDVEYQDGEESLQIVAKNALDPLLVEEYKAGNRYFKPQDNG